MWKYVLFSIITEIIIFALTDIFYSLYKNFNEKIKKQKETIIPLRYIIAAPLGGLVRIIFGSHTPDFFLILRESLFAGLLFYLIIVNISCVPKMFRQDKASLTNAGNMFSSLKDAVKNLKNKK